MQTDGLPLLVVPPFAATCPPVGKDARNHSGEMWNYLSEGRPVISQKRPLSRHLYMFLNTNIQGTDSDMRDQL
jgi:hypothetical protein